MIKERITSIQTTFEQERVHVAAQANQQTTERIAKTVAAQKKADRQNERGQKKLERLIKESGIIQDLEEMQREVLAPQHVRSVLWQNKGTIRLIWGKHFEIDSHGVPRLTIVNPWTLSWIINNRKQTRHDWNQIEVHVNTFRDEITIGKSVIMKSEWRNDRSKIPDALARAYLNPEKPPYR